MPDLTVATVDDSAIHAEARVELVVVVAEHRKATVRTGTASTVWDPVSGLALDVSCE